MRLGRTISRATLGLALAVTSLAATPVAAAGFHGGGFGGYHGGFGGYHGGFGGYRGYGGYGYRGYYGGFGFGDALLGAAIIGGTAAVIASQPTYYETYPAPVYQAYPAPPEAYGYAPPPPPAPQQQAYQSSDPVELCTQAAVGEAASRGDTGRVTKIDRVDGFANGAHVTGTLEVRRSQGGTENARFTCTADYGQVTAFRFG